MAMSTPSVSKNKFLITGAFEKTPKSQNFTPKTNYVTPKSKKIEMVSSTPECFSSVQVETPLIKKRISKEKFDEVSNLTVAVRIRPMNSRELLHVGSADVVGVRDKEIIIKSHPVGSSNVSIDHVFQYDQIFWSCEENHSFYSTQEEVFLTLGKPLLNSAFKGYNGCLFAYGQTGSGKSYSMMGRNMCEVEDIDCPTFSGITPRFCRELFEQISKLDKGCLCTVEVSYFEIYNEKIHDLLSNANNSTKTPLKVREHPECGPYVVGLNVEVVKTYEELRNCLLIGNRNRATAATTMNEKSSRSHSIFSIELCLSDEKNRENASRKSKISLVDLAGSERLGNSCNNDVKIREGVSINKSLLTLGKVISALADQKKNQFVPYRESVLTWLLRESLGGNSLTTMLATITPANTHLDETLATLRYACQARSIVNRARINENPHDRLIRELRSEVERLRALRQDYERNSFSISSTSSCNESHEEELESLRGKLKETEGKLHEAEKSWEIKFLESKETQLRELAEAEKYKAELESKVRIMKTLDSNVTLSPFRSNFLEELEGVLTNEADGLVHNDIIEDLKKWCCQNSLICTFTSDTLIIKDPVNYKQTSVSLNSVNLNGFENISDFINSLNWTENKTFVKKITKSEIMTAMNNIYQSLAVLQPPEQENNLCLLFAKVNKTLQSFEAALMTNLKTNKNQKAVTFSASVLD
ncbi:unnamed protein product [Phyllotreta striolata]|uniref:Kinesin-like protein n=1 Tax=Phyllotreta striolata TaxID=444603 RepID=A0A9N9XLN7_PHYSR|nr:unnamed protein product [Phyllotreta striolata]